VPILTEMPGGRPGGAAGDAAGATLFLVAYGQIWEIISGMLSSPWTAESFGADEGKKQSFNRYLMHATVNGAAVSLIAAYVSRRAWPLVGSGLGLGYAWFLYQRALARATHSQSEGWGSGLDLGLKKAQW
jgi:hypothetical protein